MRYACRMLVVAALLMPVAAVADDGAETSALARQVVSLSVAPGIDGRIERMIGDAVAKQPADKQAEVRTSLSTAATGIREDLLKVFAGYYAGSFSSAELKELLAFYQGPLGQKALRVEEQKPAAVNAQIEQQIMKLVTLLNAIRPAP